MSDSCGRQDKSSLPPSLRASWPEPPGCEPQEREAWWVRRGPASGEGRGMVEFAKSLLSAKRGNRKSVLFPLAGKGHSERLSIAGGPGRRRLACKPAVCKTRKTPRSPETGVTRSKSRKGCRRCRSTCGDPATARDRRRRGPRLATGQRASHARPPQAQGRGGHPRGRSGSPLGPPAASGSSPRRTHASAARLVGLATGVESAISSRGSGPGGWWRGRRVVPTRGLGPSRPSHLP